LFDQALFIHLLFFLPHLCRKQQDEQQDSYQDETSTEERTERICREEGAEILRRTSGKK
jgi:hypothetical protein